MGDGPGNAGTYQRCGFRHGFLVGGRGCVVAFRRGKFDAGLPPQCLLAVDGVGSPPRKGIEPEAAAAPHEGVVRKDGEALVGQPGGECPAAVELCPDIQRWQTHRGRSRGTAGAVARGGAAVVMLRIPMLKIVREPHKPLSTVGLDPAMAVEGERPGQRSGGAGRSQRTRRTSQGRIPAATASAR